MTYWTWGFVAVLATWAGTGLARRYALNKQLLDQPDARRNHSIATPRGGGIAIMVTLVGTVIALAWQHAVDQRTLVLLGLAIALVGSIGWWDDHRPLSARLRLCVHALAALCLFFAGLAQGWALWLCVSGAVIAVALINIWNFMDGIDGLASLEAIFVCLSAALIYALMGFSALAWAPLLLSFAVAGFLYWNFPPAKIFMGDAGSGFLGVTLGIFSLQAAWASPSLIWVWVILMGVFIVDATFTLIRRLVRGDKVYEAHRSHAYQVASRHYGRHLPVTLTIAAINMIWLLPIACWVVLGGAAEVGLALAYAPLIWLSLRFKAGAAG